MESNLVLETLEGADVDQFGRTHLTNAILSKDNQLALELIANGVDVNVKDDNGDTALWFAIISENIEIIRALLKAKADVNASGEYGETALFLAVDANIKEVVDLLIENGADVNASCKCDDFDRYTAASSKYGYTPLMHAVCKGSKEIVRALIEANADVSSSDEQGRTALLLAVDKDHKEIVELLIENDADVNAPCRYTENIEENIEVSAFASHRYPENRRKRLLRRSVGYVKSSTYTALMNASMKGNTDIVAALLQANAQVNTSNKAGETALFLAVTKENKDIVAQLIENGADVNVSCIYEGIDKFSPLMCAAKKGNIEIVKALIHAHAKVNASNKYGQTALFLAVHKDDVRIVDLLIKNGSNVNVSCRYESTNGCTPLMCAVMKGNIEIIRELIQAKTNVNMSDERGRNSLFVAVNKDHQEIVELLIENGADVNASCEYNGTYEYTPLMHATTKGNIKIVRALLQAGAKVYAFALNRNAETLFGHHDEYMSFQYARSSGYTALMYAAISGDAEIVAALLQAKANVNACNAYGETALFIAVDNNNKEIVELLIANGANVNVPCLRETIYGYTPLMCAVEKENIEILRTLLQADANVNASDEHRNTALFLAVNKNNKEVVQLLIEYGADVNVISGKNEDVDEFAGRRNAEYRTNFWTTDLEYQRYRHKRVGGHTALICAVLKGNIEIIRALLQARVNVSDDYGRTALFLAIDINNNEIVDLLIQNGANVQASCKYKEIDGYTPLMHASTKGNVKVVRALLEAGANVSASNNFGQTALFLAVVEENEDIVQLLISSGADVNVPFRYNDSDRATPLVAAPSIENVEALPWAYDNLATVLRKRHSGNRIPIDDMTFRYFRYRGYTALMCAAMKGKTSIVVALLQANANVNASGKDGTTALFVAVHTNNKEVVELLIENGADVNVCCKANTIDQCTPLICAAKNGNVDMVRKLLEADANVNASDERGQTALFLAADKDVAELLIEAGANVNVSNNNGETPLFGAVQRGKVELVLLFVQKNAVVDHVNNNGKTVLHIALEYQKFSSGDKNVLKMCSEVNDHAIDSEHNAIDESKIRRAAIINALLECVNVKDQQGQTALFYAVQEELEESSQILINAGADVHIKDNKERSPLFYTARNKNTNIISALITAGANVDERDADKETPLFNSVRKGNMKVIEALIHAGSKVSARNAYGRTPLFYAIDSVDPLKVSSLLLSNGAQLNQTDSRGCSVLLCYIEKLCCSRKLNQSQIDILDIFEKNKLSSALDYFTKDAPNCCIYFATINMLYNRLPNLKRRHRCIGRTTEGKFLLNGIRLATIYASNKHARLMLEEFFHSSNGPNKVFEMLDVLIKLGADPNSVDSYGNTALHHAVQRILCGIPEDLIKDIISKLEGHGARFDVKNHNNQTPLMFALSIWSDSQTVDLSHDDDYSDDSYDVDDYLDVHDPYYRGDCDFLDSLDYDRYYDDDEYRCICNSYCKRCHSFIDLLDFVPYSLYPYVDAGYDVISNVNVSWKNFKAMKVLCQLLLNGHWNVNETARDGASVFHILMRLFRMALDIHDREIQERVLEDLVFLLKLFGPPDIIPGATVNKRDNSLKSPLHLWASLSLPQDESYRTNISGELTFEHLLKSIFDHLRTCGVKLNDRDGEDRTPLHHCNTWSAVKFLVEAGANRNDVDSMGRPPLLAAAYNKVFSEKDECFFPDVTNDPTSFFRECCEVNLDLWAQDKDGQSILSLLLSSHCFVLAKGLVEVSCELRPSVLSQLLLTLCKDQATHTFWKSSLVGQILSCPKRPEDLNLPLCECCGTFKELYELGKVQSTSVHLDIVRQLLLRGADGRSCENTFANVQHLHHCLTEKIDLNEAPLSIPWTSYSKKHKEKLERVARKQNETSFNTTYWYHKDPIGSGTFGHVFAGISEKDGKEIAIKKIDKLRMVRPEDRREILNLTATADCAQVVKYICFYEGDEHFSYIVSELMEGHLDDYLTSSSYDPRQSLTLCRDLVEGLKYLHNHRIAPILHRDLKPGNILYKDHPKLCLKIADFGLSSPLTTSGTTVLGTHAGTRCWIAPEVIRSPKYKHTKKSDIYSCGLLLHYILSPKQHPFSPTDCSNKSSEDINFERQNNMRSNTMNNLCTTLYPEATHLIKSLLSNEAPERPSAADSLLHPMFWTNKKKLAFLYSVGNQSEIERPPCGPLLEVPSDIEASFSKIDKYPTWDDARYTHMPGIRAEMKRRYDTGSALHLLRFIRNAISHVSEEGRPPAIRKQILEDAVFLEYFPNLVMEVYQIVITKHGWGSREEIKHAMLDEDLYMKGPLYNTSPSV